MSARRAQLAALLVLGGAALVGAGLGLRWLYRWSSTATGNVNFPPPWLWWRLYQLSRAAELLSDMGEVRSAFRDGATNHDVGGVATSKHVRALAFDMRPVPPYTVLDLELAASVWRDEGVYSSILVHDAGSGPHLHVELPG